MFEAVIAAPAAAGPANAQANQEIPATAAQRPTRRIARSGATMSSMRIVERLEELAHDHFSAKHAARERSLAHARLLIRHAGNAIRAADSTVVVAGGTGLRRAGLNVARLMRRALALVLAVFGLWLIFL